MTMNQLNGACGFLVLILMVGCAATSEPKVTATESAKPDQEVVAAKDLIKPSGDTVIKQKGEDDLICRTIKPTGSRFGQKTCLTKAEWAEITAGGKRVTDKLLKGGMTGQPGGGGGG